MNTPKNTDNEPNNGYIVVKLNWDYYIFPYEAGMQLVKCFGQAEGIQTVNRNGVSAEVLANLSKDQVQFSIVNEKYYNDLLANSALLENNE